MSDEIREHIIDVASDKMNQVGIRSVSIDDVCREIGISKKTFYVLFETKDALVDAVLHRQEQNIEELIRRETTSKSVLEILVDSMQIVHHSKAVMQPPPFLYDLQKYYPRLFETHKHTIYISTQQHLLSFLQRGVDEGVICADVDVVLTSHFLARLHQGLLEALEHPDNEREESSQIFCHGMKLIMRGILTDRCKDILSELSDENKEHKHTKQQ